MAGQDVLIGAVTWRNLASDVDNTAIIITGHQTCCLLDVSFDVRNVVSKRLCLLPPKAEEIFEGKIIGYNALHSISQEVHLLEPPNNIFGSIGTVCDSLVKAENSDSKILP
jgi:hypothetical protein